MTTPTRPPQTLYAEVKFASRTTTGGDTIVIPCADPATVEAMPQAEVDALFAAVWQRLYPPA